MQFRPRAIFVWTIPVVALAAYVFGLTLIPYLLPLGLMVAFGAIVCGALWSNRMLATP